MRELGFGLGMAPNAIAALRRLGIADAVLARGFRPTRGELRRMDVSRAAWRRFSSPIAAAADAARPSALTPPR